ncbi:MAG: FAD-binding oxidoreductase [Bacteroidetes bacterium]|nr:MAG: FAD-binding oxidoreductase [Bacteroidota bacterium]
MERHAVIIGGGLAGSFMAARLTAMGCRVTMIDDAAPGSASPVAAGLFNVITGRFGAKTWMADVLLAELKAFFALPAFAPLGSYVHPLPIYRPFHDTGEYNTWLGRSADEAYSRLVRVEELPLMPAEVENPLGGISVLPCGWVHTGPMLEEMWRIMAEGGRFTRLQKTLSYDSIDLATRQIEGLPFDDLIFAEGWRIRENPWFGHLPILPNKGEILTIESDSPDLPFILSQKCYLIPLGQGRYVAGATYANQFGDIQPSAAGREEICAQLDKVWKAPYRVTEHRAGIRPTTPDRRPIFARHPEYPFMYAVAGFGTKGLLSAPHFSQLMAESIWSGEWRIPPDASAERFRKKSKSS